MSRVKIVILDMQKSFYQGLTSIFNDQYPELQVVGCYTSSQKMILESSKDINIVIMDLSLEDESGIEKIPIIKKTYPKTKIIIYTSYTDSKFVKKTFQLGVDGYISKYNEVSDLRLGIEEVMKGKNYLSKGIRITPAALVFKDAFKREEIKNKFEDKFQISQKLTSREIEILNQIVQAKNNKQIGKDLFISDQTVGVHRKNIMRKLNIKSTISLIKYAFENELV